MKMIPAVLFLLSTSVLCHGQILKTFGFKAGPTISKLEWEYRTNSGYPVERYETKNSLGYALYMTADLSIKKYWDINSSLGFIQKHGNFEYPSALGQGSKGGTENSYKLNYLSFINVVRGKLKIYKSLDLTGQLGPRIEYLVSYSDRLQTSVPYLFYEVQDDDIQRFNFGLTGGIGLTINFNRFKLGIEGTRNLNFNPIIHAKGPRLDNLGDEGFYVKLRDRTYTMNFSFVWTL